MANAFVAATDLGNNGGSTSSLTASYTCGSGSNRRLYVGLKGDSTSDLVTGATYNTVAMRLVGKRTSGDRWAYLFALDNPASGAHNVVISASSNTYILALAGDYSGVKQTGADDKEADNSNAGGSSVNTSLTTVANNCWAIAIGGGYQANNPPSFATGTRRTYDAAFGTVGLADSNAAITPAGSYSETISYGSASSGMNIVLASFEPDTGGATRGLFRTPGMAGIGVGGSFFRDALQSRTH